MARITLDLNQFRASGVYTIEFDQSERIVLTTETIRLVVGFSKTGVFNAPVFLRDVATARRVFGEIDKSLEARGSFFHRSIETCLLTGPVLALNLLPLRNIPIRDGGDATDYRSFSLDISKDNGIVSRDLVSSWFDKERFWRADRDNFIAIAGNNAINRDKLLHIANISQKPVSIFIRKAEASGFDITAREWYRATDVPAFINPNDLMRDYFIEMTLVQGDWTDYERLSQDPVFSRFFDKRGIIINRINEFLALEETTAMGTFVGCVIPDFIDRNGSNQSIETIVNNGLANTGIFLTINRDLLADAENTGIKIDLIGHSLVDSDKNYIDFLSYNISTNSEIEYDNLNIIDLSSSPVGYDPEQLGRIDVFPFVIGPNIPTVTSAPLGGVSGYFANVLTIPRPLPTNTVFTTQMYQQILDKLNTNSLIWNGASDYGFDFLKVEAIVERPNSIEVRLSNPEFINAIKNDTMVFDLATETLVFNSSNPIPANSYATVYISGPGFGGYYELFYDGTTINIVNGDNLAQMNSAQIENGGTLNISVWLEDDYYFGDVTIGNQLTMIFEPNGNIEVTYTNGRKAIESFPFSPIALDIRGNRLVDSDRIYDVTGNINYINVDETFSSFINIESGLAYGITGTRLRQFSNIELTTQVDGVDFIGFGESADNNGSPFSGDLIVYSSSVGDFKYTVDIVEPNAASTAFNIPQAEGSRIEVGYYIVNFDGDALTRVKSKVRVFDPNTGNVYFRIETLNPVEMNGDQVTVVRPINVHADRLQFTHLAGFRLTEWHLPGNGEQLWKILSVLENTNLGKTLKSTDIISFRYIIDTFDFGIEPNMGAKSILSRLAKNRQKCMALLNAPSIKRFVASTDPRFTDLPDPDGGNPRPLLRTEYIASGGNLTLGPSFTFSLPDEENGAKFIGVFSPFFTYRDNNMNFNVPPAADVSNNFIRKFLSGQQYSITAGPRRGIISNPKFAGLEYDFTLEDREFLEPFGINPIVNVRNVGPMIFANQSGYQRTQSAFNNLHVRDLLITIETAIEDVLKQYLFEFNSAVTRLEIKSIVENYLVGVQNAGGISTFTVIMDSINNPNEIIDQRFAIIDVGVEPAIGAQKFINRITVLRTGAISSGGFTVA